MAGTWTSSEDEDFGSLGDNKVIVTGGTSGIPATFADFVTADRAGEAVLLAATAGLSPTLALSFALRPVDVTALLISFIVASKTTETDHIFITGTDWRGAAQTESLDVSAGNGTYVTTKYFATISNIDCSDNSAGGGTQWADGTVRVTQPQWGLVWDMGLGQYRIDAQLWDVGDNSTTTNFTSKREMIRFSNEIRPLRLRGQATLRIGDVGALGTSKEGSFWAWETAGAEKTTFFGTGILLAYGSMFHNLGSGPLDHMRIENASSILQDIEYDGFQYLRITGAATFTRVNLSKGDRCFRIEAAANFSDLRAGDFASYGIYLLTPPAGVEIGGLAVINDAATADDARSFNLANDVDIIDSTLDWTKISMDGTPTAVIFNVQTVNIHVADRAGVDLQSVTVLCEDKDDAQQFSVSTDANGDIAVQRVQYQRKETNESLTTFSPHKFTISKAGYETLILDAVTLNLPIVWHLELQRSASINTGLIA